MYVQLEIDAERELRGERHEEELGESAVCARMELPAAVGVAENVAGERERDARGLLRVRRPERKKRRSA